MRALIGFLTVVVVALAGSWAWVQFGPGLSARGPGGNDGGVGVGVSPAGPGPERVIRVQVLNGTREGGVASRLASYLREGGFHVVEVKNADRSDYGATLVVARSEDPSAARAVARYLGHPPVVLQARSADPAEVTVVIGSDRSRVHIEP